MNKAHSPINWENYPKETTPINEENLNKMDSAIGVIDDRVIVHENTKATKEEVEKTVTGVSYDESSGIFTFTRKNGETIQADVSTIADLLNVPNKTSDLQNDTGFITNAVSDLANYYLKSETYTRDEVKALLSAIPKFSIQPVASLPTTDISTTTVYLLKSGDETDNLYTEYIYVDGAWEYLGKQTVDLSGYALKTEIPTKISELTNDAGFITNAVNNLVNYYTSTVIDEKLQQLSEEIVNEVVKKVDLYQTILSSNIFDFSTLQTGYLDGTTGKIYTGNSYDNYMYSEMYIPVSEGDVISCQYTIGGTSRTDSAITGVNYFMYCIACYDSNKNFVQGYKGGVVGGQYTIPDGVSYIRICFQASLMNNTNFTEWAIVKNSANIPIPYEPYGEYLSEIIKEEHLPNTTDDTNVTKGELYVSLPTIVHVKVGNEFKVYFRNVISNKNLFLWVGYNSNLTTRYYDDYFSVVTTAEGTYNLPWKLFDEGHTLYASGSLDIVATANVPTDTTTALVIGDSTVNAGTMTDKVKALYTADGATLNLLGTRGSSHEGRGGWTAEMYCTVASSGDIANPFYNDGFDFSYYMKNQGYSGVQAVVVQLGINDIFAFKDYDWALYDSTEPLEYINQIVTSILAYDSTIKVIINLPITPNSNGTSFTETYGTTQLYWTYNKNIIRFAEELRDYYANNSSVTISASNCILDTKTQINDGVHPTADGYNALGQRLYEVLISIVDGVVVAVPLLDISARTRVIHSGTTISATSTRELDTTKCYDGVFNGTRSASGVITAYNAVSANSLSIQVSTAGGTGMEFPVDLEAGKTYTLDYTVDNTGRVYVMKYNSDTTYNSNTMLSSASGTYTKTITAEEGYLYGIIFVPMVKDILVTFSGISLEEN